MSAIIRPIITEKANNLSESLNRFSFYVQPNANKIVIKKEVEQRYNVEVIKVNTSIEMPKRKVKNTRGGLQVGKSNKLKRALVHLKEGQTIDIFGN